MNDILLQLAKAKKKCQDLQGNDQTACYYESHTSWDYVTVRNFFIIYTSLLYIPVALFHSCLCRNMLLYCIPHVFNTEMRFSIIIQQLMASYTCVSRLMPLVLVYSGTVASERESEWFRRR